jgi:hypothetical protein
MVFCFHGLFDNFPVVGLDMFLIRISAVYLFMLEDGSSRLCRVSRAIASWRDRCDDGSIRSHSLA